MEKPGFQRPLLRPGQEWVWDYPRPPRLEPTDKLIVVEFAGQVIARTERAYRLLETSHPPTYYIPPEDVEQSILITSSTRSYCEFKGMTLYWSLRVGERMAENTAWCYPEPAAPYAAIRAFFAFYPSRVDACYVAGERVQAQAGDFYGGWITADIVGPYKGGPGTLGW